MSDLDEVYAILQGLSEYLPDKMNYKKNFENFTSQSNVKGYVCLFEDNVVGYGSIVFENKIRGGILSHIEDIVVSEKYRGHKIGLKLINYLVQVSKSFNAYKISLACNNRNIIFYEKCGFQLDGLSMSIKL